MALVETLLPLSDERIRSSHTNSACHVLAKKISSYVPLVPEPE
jgi:hypothetical protein